MAMGRAQKKLKKPRFALLLLMLVGLFAQSLLGVSGETHEFLLHADAGDTYADLHAPHTHDEEEPGQEPTALHALLHQSCGGHCPWMSGIAMAAFAPLPAATFMADEPVRRIPIPGPVSPFRPPIRS